jgi:hypothetical protein
MHCIMFICVYWLLHKQKEIFNYKYNSMCALGKYEQSKIGLQLVQKGSTLIKNKKKIYDR